MQKPTAVGSSGASAGSPAAASATRSGCSGGGLGSQKRGYEQISALFDHGVAVAIRGSAAAHAASRCSQPGVTTVSELSSTTSASPVSANAALQLAGKPRFVARRTTRAASAVRPLQFSSSGAIRGSLLASSATSTAAPAGSVRSSECRHASSASSALYTGTTTV